MLGIDGPAVNANERGAVLKFDDWSIRGVEDKRYWQSLWLPFPGPAAVERANDSSQSGFARITGEVCGRRTGIGEETAEDRAILQLAEVGSAVVPGGVEKDRRPGPCLPTVGGTDDLRAAAARGVQCRLACRSFSTPPSPLGSSQSRRLAGMRASSRRKSQQASCRPAARSVTASRRNHHSQDRGQADSHRAQPASGGTGDNPESDRRPGPPSQQAQQRAECPGPAVWPWSIRW